MSFMRWIYSICFPLIFLAFLPGLIYKLIRRPGWKATFGERFGFFSADRRKEFADFHGCIWIHAVSVGETMIALELLKKYQKACPNRKFVLSTTTTTGQALARDKVPENVPVIFCPLDFSFAVNRALNLLRPGLLVIFETEIWPNLICFSRKRGIPVALVNARMSDHSSRGYYRMRCFFRPLLQQFSVIAAQSQADADRFLKVSPHANVKVTGNLKFDQSIPADLQGIDYSQYFRSDHPRVLLAASTHPNEELFILGVYTKLRKKYPDLHLVIVPRHAERGTEIAALLENTEFSYLRRSKSTEAQSPVDILLADTTGEMLKLMKNADVVIMGKSLAGNDEGHNLIEPALLEKPIVCGSVLRNFRFLLDVLRNADAVRTADTEEELFDTLDTLFADDNLRASLGKRAGATVNVHAGATNKIITLLEETIQ